MKNSNFIRDLLVKVLLIVIFIFLLMYLFPMPNLKPFYSSIFNDNIQTMKDAAEDYYTTERMPKENGKSTKMTLQEMLDQKLIVPFVDKDNNSCDTNKSYVKVTKKDKEYELKVSLTCGKESNYIIEKIGCYNFCPTGNCTLAEVKKNEEAAKTPVTTKTDKDGNVTVVVPTGGRYIYEYEYKKTINTENWKVGDWRNTTVKETNDVKLVDKRTQYTGQKKVTSGTTLYEQISYGTKEKYTYDKDWTDSTTCSGSNCSLWKERTLYTGQKKVETKTTQYKHEKYGIKDNWTYDQNWTTNTSCTPKANLDGTTSIDPKCQLWKERTLYTGQKKITSGTTEYKHEKYGTKDNWTYDNDWTTEVKKETNNLKLWKERTLYTGQKKVETKITQYKHIKYGTKYDWQTTDWTTVKTKETDDVKLVDKRHTVRKTVKTTTTTCDNWTLDSTWYKSKPADTSTKKYANSPANTKTDTNWTVIDDSLKSKTTHSTYEGDLWYELLSDSFEKCTSNCGNDIYTRYYYYRVKRKSTSYSYQYNYCTPKSSSSTSSDEKVVSDSELQGYINNGYTKIKTEYKYKVRNTIKYVEDVKWTTSSTAPSGYEYTGKNSTTTTIKYEQLDKWVTNREKLGEYTYNVKTFKQYKYAHNNPTRYLIDVKWTTSITPPSGYEYTGKNSTTTTVKYEQLDKWVTNKEKLGEYTYNVKTFKQYKYAHNNPTRYLIDVKWTTSITPPNGYEYTGKKATTTTIKYEQLDKWVTNKEKLGEYTYNVKTLKQYKYAYNNPTRYLVDVKWTNSSTAPSGYEYTGKKATTTTIKYEQLNKWVTSASKLGEYTYNIKTRKQYKYKYLHTEKYVKDIIWTTENVARSGYELTGKTKTTSKTTYVDLGKWVNSKSDLGEYTYNIKTRTQYKYKYRTITSKTETKWARTNPGNGFEPTGNYRKTWIQDYAPVNRQK